MNHPESLEKALQKIPYKENAIAESLRAVANALLRLKSEDTNPNVITEELISDLDNYSHLKLYSETIADVNRELLTNMVKQETALEESTAGLINMLTGKKTNYGESHRILPAVFYTQKDKRKPEISHVLVVQTYVDKKIKEHRIELTKEQMKKIDPSYQDEERKIPFIRVQHQDNEYLKDLLKNQKIDLTRIISLGNKYKFNNPNKREGDPILVSANVKTPLKALLKILSVLEGIREEAISDSIRGRVIYRLNKSKDNNARRSKERRTVVLVKEKLDAFYGRNKVDYGSKIDDEALGDYSARPIVFKPYLTDMVRGVRVSPTRNERATFELQIWSKQKYNESQLGAYEKGNEPSKSRGVANIRKEVDHRNYDVAKTLQTLLGINSSKGLNCSTEEASQRVELARKKIVLLRELYQNHYFNPRQNEAVREYIQDNLVVAEAIMNNKVFQRNYSNLLASSRAQLAKAADDLIYREKILNSR